MAEEVKKDEAYKAKPPTVGEYYGALHVAMAAESLIGAITRKGTKHFPQGAFEKLCGELHKFRENVLSRAPEEAKDSIFWRVLDIENYFEKDEQELERAVE
jgi:hypothetical protein